MTVMVFGTFDILHPGHLNFFRQAKKYGDKLIVVVARDENVKKIKKHWPKFGEKKRLANVKKVKIVDNAILGDKKDFFKVIKKEKPEVVCLGYDQKRRVAALKNKLRALGLKMKVYRLKAYRSRIYKSSKLKIENFK